MQDFSTFPGSYDMEVWWVGTQGKKLLLQDLGDNKHFDYFVEGDKLAVRYWTAIGNHRDGDRWTKATFDSPDSKPKLTGVPDPFRAGDYRDWRFDQAGRSTSR